MVKAKTTRPTRRNPGAGPQRPTRRDPAQEAEELDVVRPLDEGRYPNLAAQRQMDRQRHIKAAREMGASQEQARRHADAEVGGH